MLTPWFGAGLKFGCTACGKCCRSTRTNVWVNSSEISALAAALKMEPFSFAQQYCEDRENENGEILTSLKNKDGGCILLDKDGRKCSVYEVRPVQCRTYPFWPSAVVGKAEWSNEATRCEGINASSAKIHSLRDISRQLVLGQVHDRGVGQQWTYEEADALLVETEKNNPDILADFAQDFFNSHSSMIVYETASIRVVDVTVPVSENVDDGMEGNEADADIGMSRTAAVMKRTTRRLDFIDRPMLSQTEVLLSNTSNNLNTSAVLTPDPSSLQMRVHELLATACETVLDTHGGRMALIGAGGCALPSYLLHKHKHSKIQPAGHLIIDAVDMSAEVLDVASTYFGATFLNKQVNGEKATSALGRASGMFSYHMEGLTYLKHLLENEHVTAGLDVLVIDASQAAKLSMGTENSEKEVVDLAPPPAFMHASGLKRMTQSLRPGGVLALNLLGPPEWMATVQKLITDAKASDESIAFIAPMIFDIHASAASNHVLVAVRAGTGAEAVQAALSEAMAKYNRVHF